MLHTHEQLAQLKRQLETRRSELRQMIQDELSAAGHDQLVGQVQDTGEASLMDLLAGLDIGLAEIDTRELKDIEAALYRMEQGRYGECVDCSETIAIARLQSQPAASRCISCQEKFEAESAAGTPRL